MFVVFFFFWLESWKLGMVDTREKKKETRELARTDIGLASLWAG
jgi:hypothetical protein